MTISKKLRCLALSPLCSAFSSRARSRLLAAHRTAWAAICQMASDARLILLSFVTFRGFPRMSVTQTRRYSRRVGRVPTLFTHPSSMVSLKGPEGLVFCVCVTMMLFSSASASKGALCSLYTNCVDCACSRLHYAVDDACETGCAWLPSSGVCVDASLPAANTSSAITTLWTSPGIEEELSSYRVSFLTAQDLREKYVQDGATTCKVPYGEGTIATLCAFFVVSILFQASNLFIYVRGVRRHQKLCNANADWLAECVRSHIPEGDRIIWRGTAAKPTMKPPSGTLALILAVLYFVPLTVPSIVWVAIGVPYATSQWWEFGFYFPICWVGGLGLVFAGVVQLIRCRKKPAMLQSFAVTNRHAVTVTGNMLMKDLSGPNAGVKSVGIHAVMSVERTANTVKFSAAQYSDASGASQTTDVQFANLSTADATTLFTVLQQLQPDHPVPASAVASDLPPSTKGGDISLEMPTVAASAAAPVTGVDVQLI